MPGETVVWLYVPDIIADGFVRIKPPLLLLYSVLVNKLLVVLLNVGVSSSSLSSLTIIESRISTREISALAATSLNLPPSSWNLTRYVPASAGAITSVTFPAAASITSWAAWKVAEPPVRFVCLT